MLRSLEFHKNDSRRRCGSRAGRRWIGVNAPSTRKAECSVGGETPEAPVIKGNQGTSGAAQSAGLPYQRGSLTTKRMWGVSLVVHGRTPIGFRSEPGVHRLSARGPGRGEL